MLKALLWVPLLLFLPLSECAGQENTPSAPRSVALLVDTSYSMRLPAGEPGIARLEAARRAVRRLLGEGRREDGWALLTFSGPGSARLLQPLTRDPWRIERLLPSLRADGTTSPEAALAAAAEYLAANGGEGERLLVLVSDCLPTEGGWPDPALLRERRVGLEVVDVGGDAVGVDAIGEGAVSGEGAAAAPPSALPPSPAGRSAAAPGAAESGGRRGSVGSTPGAARRPASSPRLAGRLPRLLAAAAALALLFPFLRGFRPRFPRFRPTAAPLATAGGGAAGRGAAAPAPRLSLSVGPAGAAAGAARRSYRFDRLPLRVGPGARCELRLDPPGPRGRGAGRGPQRPWFEIRGQGGEACLAAEDPLLVNGVLQRRKVLRPGDRITCGAWRISLDEVVLVQPAPVRPGEERPAPPRSGPGLVRGLGVFLCLLAAGLALVLPLRGGGAADGRLQPSAAAAAAGGAPDPFPPGPDPAAVEMVPPGAEPLPGRADILLFHAHPDDESLEYGGLAARASRAGLRVAAVLFSDGEGGLDRWPERGAGGIYPARRLRGKTLALVRVQEARRALAALGARVYVRLGRRNHAYEGPGQALDLRQTLADWGGEEALVARVRRLIETCRPALVVAPDGPSAAREHFEHQAAGRVVARAVEEVRRAGSVPLRGFLVPVDPLQRALYPSSFGLPVGSERGAQALALRQHQTQRAAAVIGLETLTSLPHEYYQAVFWSDGAGRSPPAALEEWLGP